MPKISYVPKHFNNSSLMIINAANKVITDYQAQGYVLTLRQLFYRLVTKDILQNTQRNYKRLGNILNDARLAGAVDWDAIEDRTRNLSRISTWEDPSHIIDSAAHGFRRDLWEDQDYRLEVWVEKEALAGVFGRVCSEWRMPLFSCRGYVSQSEMWAHGLRFKETIQHGRTPVILHFGDHDPSGIDMTRDIRGRLKMFAGIEVHVERMALNYDQVEEFKLLPNPAKDTDSRFEDYVHHFGNESWELDALEPKTLSSILAEQVSNYIDFDLWNRALRIEDSQRDGLKSVSAHFSTLSRIAKKLNKGSK